VPAAKKGNEQFFEHGIYDNDLAQLGEILVDRARLRAE
jgi:hypothetical protein